MKILVGFAFGVALAVAGPASAQTYACQYTDSNGFALYKDGNWKRTGFKIKDPFFIEIVDGNIDPRSVNSLVFGGKCHVLKYDGVHSCTDGIGTSLYFSPDTDTGGVSNLMGAVSNKSKRKPVDVALFVCQQM